MVDLLQPIRRFLNVTFVLTLVVASAFCPSLDASATSSDLLAGRLGGSYESFVAAYGEPAGLNASIGEVFTVEGYGMVSAQFSRKAGPTDDESPALLITLRSERGENVPATQLDDADWTVDVAAERAAAFAPGDAEISTFESGADGSLSSSCTSKALTAAFGQLGEGGCSIRAVQPVPGRVSFITLSLVSSIVANEVATPESACAGVEAWAQESGVRMTNAQDLMEQLAAMDPATPTVDDDLVALQSSLAELAADQRGAKTPDAAVTANFYLIGAFSGYASAVGNAASGLAESDQALIDQAAAQITSANEKIDRASTEIAQLAVDCDLEIVSPEATP